MVLRRQAGVFLTALIGAVALLLLSSSAQGQVVPGEKAIDADQDGAPYAAGELIVTYKENAPEKAVLSAEKKTGANVEEKLSEVDARLIELPDIKERRSGKAREQDLERAKKDLEKDPAVESVDYNYVYTGNYTPRDPKFNLQWGLKQTGFQKAWNKTRGRNRVRIAIVDSGARMNHQDLKGKLAVGWDFRNDNGTIEDLNGHGTHVAGIAGARTSNGIGVAGGCPNCRLIIAKAMDKNLFGYNSDISDAIIWSTKKGARVINLSLGGQAKSDVLRNAINYAQRRGVVVVAAGGNYGDNRTVYPAAYRGVIGVSHTDRYNHRVFDASYGDWIDVAAPGYDILSTAPKGYRYMNGSSMAVPHVSALAGLLASQNRGPKAIKRRILRSAQDLGPRGRDPYYGRGLIRADRAVR